MLALSEYHFALFCIKFSSLLWQFFQFFAICVVACSRSADPGACRCTCWSFTEVVDEGELGDDSVANDSLGVHREDVHVAAHELDVPSD